MRITDMFMTFPRLILAMAIAAALRPTLENVIVAISLAAWPAYARLARSVTLALREEMFVEAARALGAPPARILSRHILPGVVSPVVIQVSLDMGGIILTAAGLGFIGMGAQPPTPEWGVMIAEGRNYITTQWWVSTFPGIAIALTVLGFNLLGDGIRDALDPRLRGVG
jgi:peptide/nickel transport system permease protein